MAAFSLNPASAMQGVIDYTTREGVKLFESATKPVTTMEEKFDCEPEGLLPFLKKVAVKADLLGWDLEQNGVLAIPDVIGAANPEWINLTEEYGRVPLEIIQQQDLTYIANPSRKAQDNYMSYHCFWNSLSTIGMSKVALKEHEYTLEVAGEAYHSGPCLLRVIISESHIDTNATISNIRTQLSNLNLYIGEIGNDISKFNDHVRTLMTQLTARGEDSLDLLVNLFKGYSACSDKAFVDYINRKKEDYDEGGATLEPEDLMKFAETKYKILKQEGKWNAPTPDKQEILALKAQISKMKRARSKVDKQTKEGNKPDWFGKAPSPRELKKPFTPKEWKGRKWYYCCKETGGHCDGKWRAHDPAKCDPNFFNKKRKGGDGNEKASKKAKTPHVRLTHASQAIIDNESDEYASLPTIPEEEEGYESS